MKRPALTLLLSSFALASATETRAQSVSQSLRGLKGQAFDLAWLAAVTAHQRQLVALNDFESRYGQRAALKQWASKDAGERRAALAQLTAIKIQVQSQAARTVPVLILNVSQQTLTHFDPCFLSEYVKASAQITALARLSLSQSRRAPLRFVAAPLLSHERARLSELSRLAIPPLTPHKKRSRFFHLAPFVFSVTQLNFYRLA